MDKIKVQEIIPLTIQGEGMQVGTPCSFVRLYGCPVGCYFCDTGYANNQLPSEGFTVLTVDEILDQIQGRNVVISGGEPTVNPRLNLLIDSLIDKNHSVSIETSGTRWVKSLDRCWVTFSPKDHVSKQTSDPLFWSRASEVKIVISNKNDYHFYRDRIKMTLDQKIPVYLQPEWGVASEVLDYLIDISSRIGVKISIQTHKYLGVR
jgi:organic radical activating enzyme